MRRPLRCTSVAVALLLMAVSVSAQQPISLLLAQTEARQHAPERAVLDARVQGAEAVARPAGRVLRRDPELSMSYFPGSLTGRPDESIWTVGARWTLDVSKSWVPRGQSAVADQRRTEFEREDGLRALDERVAIAVADVALGQRLVARAARIRMLQQLAADAEHRRLTVGNGTQLETDAADIDLADARATEEQASGDLVAARVRLGRLLGRADPSTLIVEDLSESQETVQPPDVGILVERDPRVRAAQAELEAARLEEQVAQRMLTPTPTVGLDVSHERRDIPAGSFQGVPFGSALSANWTDPQVVFNIGVPLPLFDRQREPRARATARILAAESQLTLVRADVLTELESAWAELEAVRRAWQAVAGTPEMIDRDVSFVEQAVRAGAFDALTRTQSLRRLEESGRRADAAVRDLRTARAAWIRRTASLRASP